MSEWKVVYDPSVLFPTPLEVGVVHSMMVSINIYPTSYDPLSVRLQGP